MKETYVVAGGANGIGRAIAQKLAENNHVIVIDSAQADSPEGLMQHIQADLTKSKQVEQSVRELPDNIDGLILSIGIMQRGTIFESSEQDYDQLMDTNVKAVWLLLKHIRSKLKDDATIVQISSGHVLDPEPDPGIYTLSKKSVTSLIEILRLTEKTFDIRIVYPGPVVTALLLSGRTKKEVDDVSKISIQPDELADKVMELLSSKHLVLKFNPKSWDYDFE